MKTFLTCVLGLCLAGVASAQNLLVNGSFESNLTGWTTNGVSGSVFVKGTKGAEAGTLAAIFNGAGGGDATNGVIYQSIATTIGNNYSLSFYYGGYTGSTGTHGTEILGVELIGSSVIYSNTVSPATYGASPTPFLQYTESFVANSSSTIVEFFDKSSDTKSVAGVLDNVSVTAAVPEPSTMALSAAGGLFSLLALRRRK